MTTTNQLSLNLLPNIVEAGSNRSLKSQSNMAIVVIPIYKERPSKTEEIAYRQVLEVLGNHPISLVVPNGLDISFYLSLHHSLIVERFTPFYFQGIAGYSSLMISPKFYRRFIKYNYMLIYQLDAFVFRDELLEWCDFEFDYIGAPWFKDSKKNSKCTDFCGVGNGGFSLRRIRACLKALSNFSWIIKPHEVLSYYLSHDWKRRILLIPNILGKFTVRNNFFHLFNDFSGNEDRFWGIYVTNNFSWFHTATFREAIRFSFEHNPRLLFQQNNNRLPFGCHGWMRHDYEFWKPYIKQFGHYL